LAEAQHCSERLLVLLIASCGPWANLCCDLGSAFQRSTLITTSVTPEPFRLPASIQSPLMRKRLALVSPTVNGQLAFHRRRRKASPDVAVCNLHVTFDDYVVAQQRETLGCAHSNH